VPSSKLSYTFILTQSPAQQESNQTAQQLAAEILAAGDTLDRVFFYQDACYIGLKTQVPGQGLQASHQGWLDLQKIHAFPLQVCIANSLRRGLIDDIEGERYQHIANLQQGFQLAGLGEIAEASQRSDRIISL
jgi:tRNA 2-thiouridine synthesizing protein D